MCTCVLGITQDREHADTYTCVCVCAVRASAVGWVTTSTRPVGAGNAVVRRDNRKRRPYGTLMSPLLRRQLPTSTQASAVHIFRCIAQSPFVVLQSRASRLLLGMPTSATTKSITFPQWHYTPTLCAVIFIAASVTDYFDGYLARKVGSWGEGARRGGPKERARLRGFDSTTPWVAQHAVLSLLARLIGSASTPPWVLLARVSVCVTAPASR